MSRRKLIDIDAIQALRQQVAQARADSDRRFLELDRELEAMLPPVDDRETRRLRGYSKRDWGRFLDAN